MLEELIARIASWITIFVLAWMFGYEFVISREGMVAPWLVAIAGTMALATSRLCLAVDMVPARRRPSYRWQPARTRTYYCVSLTIGAGAG